MPVRIHGKMFLSIPEAAEKAGVHRQTMYRWVASGVNGKDSEPNGMKLRAVRNRSSGHYFVSASSLDAFLERLFEPVSSAE